MSCDPKTALDRGERWCLAEPQLYFSVAGEPGGRATHLNAVAARDHDPSRIFQLFHLFRLHTHILFAEFQLAVLSSG